MKVITKYLYRFQAVFCTLLCLFHISYNEAQNSYTINEILNKVMCNSPEYRLHKIQTEIDRNTYEINLESLLPSASLALSGPSYSQTISPVSQPDGSIKYLRVNNLQSNLSLNAIVPLELTGGQLSLNSNLSIYRNNNNSNISTSYSLNYYHLSYNQPLDFFSTNKWNRRITKATLSKAEIEQAENLFELKYNTIQLFLGIVQKGTNIELLEHQSLSLKKLYELSKTAYATGRMLETDLESIALKIDNIENQIESKKEEIKKLFKLLKIKTNLVLSATGTVFVCPELPFFTINTESALFRLNNKIESLYKAQLLSQERMTSQLKRKRWGSASLSMGVGLSASANSLQKMNKNKVTDYNASLNFSFPITSWSSQKKEYRNAKLNYEKLLISKQEYIDQQKIELLDLISTVKMNKKMYIHYLNKKQLLEKEERVKQNLFQSQRIIFNELEEVLDQQTENEQNIIQVINNSYLSICEIEKMTNSNFILDP